jgi:hypothetical protein
MTSTVAKGQFPHCQNDLFFQKTNLLLKFEIITFSMIYYDIVT